MRRVRFLLLIALAGCAPPAWQPVAPAPARRLPPMQTVRVHTGSHYRMLRGVVITGDSITGVPWDHSPDCERCRIAFSLASVDSIRTGRTDLGGLLGGIGTLAVIFALGAGLYSGMGSD